MEKGCEWSSVVSGAGSRDVSGEDVSGAVGMRVERISKQHDTLVG